LAASEDLIMVIEGIFERVKSRAVLEDWLREGALPAL
jgi:hypothetical protein